MIKVTYTGKGRFQHQTLWSAGADLISQECVTIASGEQVTVGTGVYITEMTLCTVNGIRLIPYISILPRSGLTMRGIIGRTGTVDADYKDEIKVTLMNQSTEPHRIRTGDRIAQAVAQLCYQFAQINPAERCGGFGSTDLQ